MHPIKERNYFTPETTDAAKVFASMLQTESEIEAEAEELAARLNDVKAEPMSAKEFKRERSRHRALLYEHRVASLRSLEFLRQSVLPAAHADRKQSMKARQSDLDALVREKIAAFTALGATSENDALLMATNLPAIRKEQQAISALAYDDLGVKQHDLPALIERTRRSIIELGKAL